MAYKGLFEVVDIVLLFENSRFAIKHKKVDCYTEKAI